MLPVILLLSVIMEALRNLTAWLRDLFASLDQALAAKAGPGAAPEESVAAEKQPEAKMKCKPSVKKKGWKVKHFYASKRSIKKGAPEAMIGVKDFSGWSKEVMEPRWFKPHRYILDYVRHSSAIMLRSEPEVRRFFSLPCPS